MSVLIPPGEHIVKCSAYSDRVADLSKEDPNGPVIGFHQHNGFNQKWSFEKRDIGFQYNISTIARGGRTTYARSSVPAGPGEVVASSTAPPPTLYTVLTTDGTNCRIFTLDANGRPLFWTLNNVAEETRVTLETSKGDGTQVWSLSRP